MGHVSLRGIRKSCENPHVIQGIDREVRDGECMDFVGRSV